MVPFSSDAGNENKIIDAHVSGPLLSGCERESPSKRLNAMHMMPKTHSFILAVRLNQGGTGTLQSAAPGSGGSRQRAIARARIAATPDFVAVANDAVLKRSLPGTPVLFQFSRKRNHA